MEDKRTGQCFVAMPSSGPLIKQQPDGPVMKNGTVVLTCEVRGGIPLATLSWDCGGSSAVITTPSIGKVTSTVQLVVNSVDNGKTCTCDVTHPLWDTNKSTTVTIVVYYLPFESLVLAMEPSSTLFIGSRVNATCHLTGGKPLATLILNCNGLFGFNFNTTKTAFNGSVYS
ncbi:unnamed protein product [Mytilus edulis]|uniref:Ig-like domain-containing protein n=1 Tax=Mytilus edulis TaxID=6550 RepID=A0A8S3TDG1_MYTED|nr:unnamed protein product [Mytilus edulis]